MALSRREFSTTALLAAAGFGLAATPARRAAAADEEAGDRLFVMDTWFWRVEMSHEERVALLAELGVPGMLMSQPNVEAHHLDVLDEHGVKLTGVYHTIQIEDEPNEALIATMRRLEGRGTTVTLAMTSREQGETSDPAGDPAAIEHVRAYADVAEELGLTVAFYPHVRMWIEQVADAVRLSKKIDRPHVGAVFNLYHWLARDAQSTTLEDTLDAAVPHLKVATINGARSDTASVPADQAILSLDEGDYDVLPVLRALNARGYEGPIGLQGYGIAGDIPAKLERSVAAWRELQRLL